MSYFQIPAEVKDLIKNGGLPITRISVSAIKEFARNPRNFFKKYILLDFNTETSGAMLVGQSVHKALEMWKKLQKEMAEKWEITDEKILKNFSAEFFNFPLDGTNDSEYRKIILENLANIWKKFFEREEKIARIKSINLILGENDLMQNIPEFWGEIEDKDIEKELENIEKIFAENLPNIYKKETRYEDEIIKFWVTTQREKCLSQIEIAIANYLNYENNENRSYDVVATEMSLESNVVDDDGDTLLPLKGVIDRVDRTEKGIEIIDYKIVSKYSDPNEAKWDYELQAGAYYVLLKNFISDEKIAKMRFVEILKDEAKYILPHDPDRRLLQKDLRELCDEHGLGWEKFEKNTDLINKLIFAKILIKEPSVREYVIDFEENHHIVPIFETFVRVTLTNVALASLYNIPFLPNIGDFFSGAESYREFVEEITTEKIERDKTKSDDYDGF